MAAHGLGGSVPETRPLLSSVAGTRVFAQAAGHGRPCNGPVSMASLAAELRQVADAYAATQALGVSLGASTLLRLLVETPDRFDRLVLFLPAALDVPRTDPAVRRAVGLAQAVAAQDRAAVEAAVRAELPEGVRAEAYVRERTAFLLTCDLLPVLAAVEEVPVPDPATLRGVRAPVLVVAQQGDDLHPVEVAQQVAAALPRSELVVFAPPGPLFGERVRLRALVAQHLTPPSG